MGIVLEVPCHPRKIFAEPTQIQTLYSTPSSRRRSERTRESIVLMNLTADNQSSMLRLERLRQHSKQTLIRRVPGWRKQIISKMLLNHSTVSRSINTVCNLVHDFHCFPFIDLFDQTMFLVDGENSERCPKD